MAQLASLIVGVLDRLLSIGARCHAAFAIIDPSEGFTEGIALLDEMALRIVGEGDLVPVPVNLGGAVACGIVSVAGDGAIRRGLGEEIAFDIAFDFPGSAKRIFLPDEFALSVVEIFHHELSSPYDSGHLSGLGIGEFGLQPIGSDAGLDPSGFVVLHGFLDLVMGDGGAVSESVISEAGRTILADNKLKLSFGSVGVFSDLTCRAIARDDHLPQLVVSILGDDFLLGAGGGT